jgi:tetratricopeptide (TPR) repeat protein
MTPSRLLLVALAVAVSAGCATTKPPAKPDAETIKAAKELGTQGANFERLNQWTSAREEFKAAMETLNQFKDPDLLMVTLEYEYGRSLGVTGHFKEAEVWLKLARDGDEHLNAPTYMDLTELARLNLDQGKYAAALPYFEQLFQELDRIGAPESTPAAYCDLLKEYADALDGVGKSQEADMKRQDIEDVKAKHPFRRSMTDRTPYGKYPDLKNSTDGAGT